MMHWFFMFTEVKSRCMGLVRCGSKRAAREVPGVVAVLLSIKMCPAWRDVSKKACGARKNSHK